MGAIQSSINTALGVAALASGLTNKKQVEKAQDKLDDTKDKLTDTVGQLANTKEDLAKTTAENKEQAETLSAVKDEENMKLGKNTYNVSNDLPTAKATNADANDKIDVISSNSINNSISSSLADFLKYQKANPYTVEQFMGSHALKIRDSRIAAKREVEERKKRAMISPQARAARNGGNE